MKVIVSNVLDDSYNDYVVINDIESLTEMDNISVLILHSYENVTDFDLGVFISKLYNSGVSSFIYINENPSMVISTVIKGVGGSVYTDEFYLEDEEELNILLEELGLDSKNSLVAQSSIKIVKDFIVAFSRNETRINSPIYLEQVKQAINELSELTHRQEMQLNEMGLTSIKVFEKASDIISTMNDQKKVLEKQLEELEQTQYSSQNKVSSFSQGSVSYFSTFRYTGMAKVLLIREYSPCRYLTSFLLSYIHHVKHELNKRVKLIIAHQKGVGVSSKYSSFTSITQESYGTLMLYENDIIATNMPNKEVMTKLTSTNAEVIIVLDRLYSRSDIIQGRVKKVCAVSGSTDVDRYKLDASQCIFPVTSQEKELFSIPLIKNYPSEVDIRYAVYNQTCKDKFKILDSYIID